MKGIRQADPLSPYLFILVTNVLSVLMKQAVENESIKGMAYDPILLFFMVPNLKWPLHSPL